MSNCVHPNVILNALNQSFNKNELVKNRFIGLQANASSFEVEELDNSKELKSTSPEELASKMKILYDRGFKIFGGCCGTNQAHLERIAALLRENRG